MSYIEIFDLKFLKFKNVFIYLVYRGMNFF